MKKWWVAAAATFVLAGCASTGGGDTATSEQPTASPSASSSPSATPSQDAQPEIDDMAVCEQYMPTASGTNGPITDEIITTYTSGSPTVEGVEDLYERLEDLEAQSSSAILAAVIGVNQPIRYMQEQIDAGNYTFNNQWSAIDAMTDLIDDCTAAGYTI